MGDGGLCELLVDNFEFRHASDSDDLFSILEMWEECMNGRGGGEGGGGASVGAAPALGPSSAFGGAEASAVGARPTGNARRREGDREKGGGGGPVQKKQKGSTSAAKAAAAASDDDGAAKVSHITVERNRRKQMNEHLVVLRSLMPCFYVKRGDQTSIIGGVVDYIKELQQVLHSLEAKKHRKVLSPRPASTASSRPPFVKSTPPLSPRLCVPISPRTPTPGSPYKPGGGGCARLPHRPATAYMSPAMTPTSSSSRTPDLSPRPYLPNLDSIITELAAQAARPASAAGAPFLFPDVKVEFAGPNLVLKTVSHPAPGQVVKIVARLESLSLEILHVSISTVDGATVHSFTIKIGVECELSAEELVHEIQQTFL